MAMERQDTEAGSMQRPSGREHIAVIRGLCGGKPHVAGHRIKVQQIALWHERMGMSPEEIGAAHPGLTLSDVHAALAYYYDHREQIDADIDADEHFVAEQKAKAGRSKLEQKLAGLHGKDDPLPPR
jgi:uncharacterized protein (DUF433 family)